MNARIMKWIKKSVVIGLQMTVRNQGPGPGWEQGGSPRKPFIPGALVSFICKWEGKKIT